MVPAIKKGDGSRAEGFNVLVGGKSGSGGFTVAQPLDAFVEPRAGERRCRRYHAGVPGPRLAGDPARARLAFLLEDWGIERFRAEVKGAWAMSLSLPERTSGSTATRTTSASTPSGSRDSTTSVFSCRWDGPMVTN